MSLANYGFSNLFTFSRSTSKQVLGPNGELITYAPNEPAFVYDQTTGKKLGISISGNTTNNLTNSDSSADSYTENTNLHTVDSLVPWLTNCVSLDPSIGYGSGLLSAVTP